MKGVLLLSLLCASVAEAAWLRYIPATGHVTCVSVTQSRPCAPMLGQEVLDIPLSLITDLQQPGSCTVPPEEYAGVLRVTSLTPLTVAFVQPIVCFQDHLVGSVAGLFALRDDFDLAIFGRRFNPRLAGLYAVRCTGQQPDVGCDVLRTRLLQELPAVEDVNTVYAEFEAALQLLSAGP